jgi:seryl-tRNA synthetase
MIDPNSIRENPEAYKQAAKDKRVNFDVDAFLALDGEYKTLKQEFESKKAEQNKVSKLIPTLSKDEQGKLKEDMRALSAQIKEIDSKLKELESQRESMLLRAPGIPLKEVPVGKDDSENVEVERWGEINEYLGKDHIQLGASLDIIDIERGVKVSGSKNYFLKGDGARLHHAVLQYALSFLHNRGYTVMEPPHIVSYDAMKGTSYFPGGEDQAYSLDERDPDKYLIGTSEVSVCSYHMNEVLEDLPKRYAGYSPCYRREAGTYGKDTYGLYRIHQFYKVEQVIMCENCPETSMKLHHELLDNAKDFIQSLNLPYRVVLVCTGDMGLGQVYKHDIECWMPSRNSYGETHSCSSFYDFQARRLNMRYKNKDGKLEYCYTLNNTLIASPRILIPLLENNQNKDGSISIPKPLQPFMGGQEVIK